MNCFKTLYLPLLALLALPALPARAQSDSPVDLAILPNISGLPVTRINATGGESNCFAIMWSGDGGWSRFDQDTETVAYEILRFNM